MDEIKVTEIKQLESLAMWTLPTDHVGMLGETPVRIWQASTEDGSQFMLAVAALKPLSGFVSAEVVADLERELLAKGGRDGFPDPVQALDAFQARPDGLARDWIRTDGQAYVDLFRRG